MTLEDYCMSGIAGKEKGHRLPAEKREEGESQEEGKKKKKL